MKKIDINELNILLSKGGTILDTRLNDEYIGWDICGLNISGHIPGAVSFPYNWLDITSDFKLHLYLSERHIDNQSILILCDSNEKDRQYVLNYLKKENFDKLFYFNLKDWNNGLEFYPGYKKLVPCIWLNNLINNKKIQYAPKKNYRIFEVSWGEASEDFMDGHIPGSIHIDSEEFEKSPEWISIKDPELISFANKYGITKDTTVIIYGMDSLNQMGAAKLLLILEYMGVKDVRLLNGTFQNWEYFGLEVEYDTYNPVKFETDFGHLDKSTKTRIYDIENIKNILKESNSDTQVVDIRTYEQWIGEDTGYYYVKKAGRIPGTLWCYNENYYRNFDNTICSKEYILTFWTKHNLDISKNIVVFCGSASWAAALVQVYARVIGFENLFIYEGGWAQWQLDSANEIIQGD